MKRWLSGLTVFAFLIISGAGQAEETGEEYHVFDLEEIVVTAARVARPLKETSSSVTIIDAGEIASTGENTVLEVLRGLPGLDVVQSGGPGATTSVFSRGANSSHTLVLVDGVEVNSPTTGGFNFANLSVDNIERIEIVRGPQSTLYGSDAIGGVIHIITQKGRGEPRWGISAEGGTFDTYRAALSASGNIEPFYYSLSISRFDTDGISRAKVGREDDGHENTSLSARISLSVSEDAELDFVLRYTDVNSDLDGFVGGTFADDLNYISDNESLIFSANFNQFLTEKWRHKVNISVNDENMEHKDPDTLSHNSKLNTRISGINWQHEFNPAETMSFVGGIEWEEQKALSKGVPWGETALVERFDESINNWGYYLNHQLNLQDSFFLSTGIRMDDHETFGSDINYQIGVTYLFSELPVKLRSNWGTGFKAPTFNDLFWPGGGNPDLLPEESTGYDLGVDFMGERVHAGVTYFHNDIDNLIAWAPLGSGAGNVNKANTEGAELEVSIQPLDELRITANYTYTETEDRGTGKELTRRPVNKYGISFHYHPQDKINLNLYFNHVGDRWSNPDNTVELESYTLVNVTASYDWSENLQVFLRGDNIFNEDYEEVEGYGTPGISVFAGLRVTL